MVDAAIIVPEPLADQHVRYAYARSLRHKATDFFTSKAWKGANDALARAAALLLGTTADFSRDMLAQQCECAFMLQNVKVAAKTCDNALKKQPQLAKVAQALKWAKEEKRKLSAVLLRVCIALQPTLTQTGACPQMRKRSSRKRQSKDSSSSSSNSSSAVGSSSSSSSSSGNASNSRTVVFLRGYRLNLSCVCVCVHVCVPVLVFRLLC